MDCSEKLINVVCMLRGETEGEITRIQETRRAITAKIKEAQPEGCVSVGVPAASSDRAI